MEILFAEPPGIPISGKRERNIENYYHREDFRRAFLNEIGTISYPARAVEGYQLACLEGWRVADINRRHLRVAVDYGDSAAGSLLSGLIAQLDVEVLALSQGTPLSLEGSPVEHVGRLVQAMEADLGMVVDAGAERLMVVDENGSAIPGDVLLMLLAVQACREYGPGVVALPLNVTELVDGLVIDNGSAVIRTKVAPAALMEEASKPDTIFAGDTTGAFIFPRFSPSADAVYAFGKVLELVSGGVERLSELAADMPVSHVTHMTATCPWHLKGTVMRMTVEEHKKDEVSLVDGIKVVMGERVWVQILPDADDPLFHVYAEAATEGAARELAQSHVAELEALIARLGHQD
ncbi:MAG: hypothetical protein GX604_06665 [Actinobacteria bacterium]|nr:hypothetical protein [Actinomycetota bacterium]